MEKRKKVYITKIIMKIFISSYRNGNRDYKTATLQIVEWIQTYPNEILLYKFNNNVYEWRYVEYMYMETWDAAWFIYYEENGDFRTTRLKILFFGPEYVYIFARHKIKFHRLAECSSKDNKQPIHSNRPPSIDVE